MRFPSRTGRLFWFFFWLAVGPLVLIFPASAAVSTSANSSGVTLVAMVLARKTERASSFGEAGDCNGAGMRGVLMGEPASKTACTLQFWPSSAGMLEAFAYQCVYTLGATRRCACLRA